MICDPDIVIRVEKLKTRFGDHIIHQDLNLEVHRGEILGVVGGSGSGKSVLMNTILGLIAPSHGAIENSQKKIGSRFDRTEIDHRIGVMFQNGALFSSLSVQENVEAPLIEHTRLREPWLEAVALMKIGLVGLDAEVGRQMPAELSGGMRKRVSVARALALDPELLFLDEPTSGLDPIAAAEFDQLIRTLSDTLGLTVVMVTHDLDSLYSISDRVAVVADQKIVEVSPIAELERSDHPWIRAFLGGRAERAKERNR